MKIGLVADSRGEIDTLEHACDFLVEEKGAERLFFLGGRWSDLDELFQRKRAQKRGGAEYSDADFLADVASFIAQSAEGGAAARKPGQDSAEAFVKRFERVPDRASPQYRDPAIPKMLPDLIGDRIACLVHDKADLTRDDIEAATFLLHGNSAAPDVVQIGTRFFLTPGALAEVATPSCALLSWDDQGMQFAAFGLDGRELKRLPLSLTTRRKMSLR